MRRVLLIGIMPILLGIVAAFFRARELAFSFDFTTGLPKGPLVVTPILLIVAGLLAVVAVLFGNKKKESIEEPTHHPILLVISLLGAAVMLALAGIEIYANQVSRDLIVYIHSALTVLCGASFAILGMHSLRTNSNGVYSFFAVVPVFWACFSLIMIFRERIADPILADYIFLLFAVICILLFTYAQTGYVYGKNRLVVALVSSVIGTYCCVTELLTPWIASLLLKQQYGFMYDFTMILPLVLFGIYMPVATICMLKNENHV